MGSVSSERVLINTTFSLDTYTFNLFDVQRNEKETSPICKLLIELFMNIESTIESLKHDTVELFLSCIVNEEICYDNIDCSPLMDAQDVKSNLFKSIVENNSNPRRIFKLVGLILIMTYSSNRKYFESKGITSDDILLADFIDNVISDLRIQRFLNQHYIVLINR